MSQKAGDDIYSVLKVVGIIVMVFAGILLFNIGNLEVGMKKYEADGDEVAKLSEEIQILEGDRDVYFYRLIKILVLISFLIVYVRWSRNNKKKNLQELIDSFISKEKSELIKFEKWENDIHPFNDLLINDSISIGIANKIIGSIIGGNFVNVDIYKVLITKDGLKKEYWLRVMFQGSEVENHKWLVK